MNNDQRIRELEREVARLSARVPLREPQSGSMLTLMIIQPAREIFNNGSGFTVRGFQRSAGGCSLIPAGCWDSVNKRPQQLTTGTTYPSGLGWATTYPDGIPVFVSNSVSGTIDSDMTLPSLSVVYSRISIVVPVESSTDTAMIFLPFLAQYG